MNNRLKIASLLMCYQGIDVNIVDDVPEVPVVEVVDSPLKSILDEIFSVDPVSGFPKGDIQYFLSKDGNPEVKAWLESNLLQPMRENKTLPDGTTDDLIAEMARRSGESTSSYAARLKGYYDSALAESERLKTVSTAPASNVVTDEPKTD